MGWLVGFLGGEDKEEQGDNYDCPLLRLALVALMGSAMDSIVLDLCTCAAATPVGR